MSSPLSSSPSPSRSRYRSLSLPVSAAVAALLAATALTGCTTAQDAAAPTASPTTVVTERAAPGPATRTRDNANQQIPGLGARTRAEIPDDSRQVLVVTGEGKNENTVTAVLYERTGEAWQASAGPWDGHNALRGWTDDHRLGDLRSPIGVFGLTDAGGLLKDPGTELPYDQGPAFTLNGTGFEGEPLAGSFDYVIAINYNRKAGTTPLDWTRPLGAEKGGGIWLHVDHGGPTQGCVSLPKDDMKELLRTLDPQARPVVVMGDEGSLSR
ncbi:L,D-transpeptidase family protein [Streptomyces sp. NPDC088387]|uniref:L,D-transpeptidase family protein n=1 Tax=Streptomyces sp. NPDC088387 TaxID=3365859 RepID=UPI00380D3D9D